MDKPITANPGTLLTDRQCEALLWTAMGKTTEEVGMILGVAKATAKTHLDMAAAKLHAHNRAQLVANAFVGGFLRTTACIVLAAACLNADLQSQLQQDHLRNFRQARTRARRRENLHPSLWDFDYA